MKALAKTCILIISALLLSACILDSDDPVDKEYGLYDIEAYKNPGLVSNDYTGVWVVTSEVVEDNRSSFYVVGQPEVEQGIGLPLFGQSVAVVRVNETANADYYSFCEMGIEQEYEAQIEGNRLVLDQLANWAIDITFLDYKTAKGSYTTGERVDGEIAEIETESALRLTKISNNPDATLGSLTASILEDDQQQLAANDFNVRCLSAWEQYLPTFGTDPERGMIIVFNKGYGIEATGISGNQFLTVSRNEVPDFDRFDYSIIQGSYFDPDTFAILTDNLQGDFTIQGFTDYSASVRGENGGVIASFTVDASLDL